MTHCFFSVLCAFTLTEDQALALSAAEEVRDKNILDKKVNKGKKRDKDGSFKRDYIIQKFSKSYQTRKKRGCVEITIKGSTLQHIRAYYQHFILRKSNLVLHHHPSRLSFAGGCAHSNRHHPWQPEASRWRSMSNALALKRGSPLIWFGQVWNERNTFYFRCVI